MQSYTDKPTTETSSKEYETIQRVAAGESAAGSAFVNGLYQGKANGASPNGVDLVAETGKLCPLSGERALYLSKKTTRNNERAFLRQLGWHRKSFTLLSHEHMGREFFVCKKKF